MIEIGSVAAGPGHAWEAPALTAFCLTLAVAIVLLRQRRHRRREAGGRA